MDNKVRSALEKALQDKAKGNHQKALKRLSDTIQKFPGEPELYFEAAEVCLEAGESMQATQFLRRAQSKFASERDRLNLFARDKVRELNDPVLGKFVLDQAIKKRDLGEAMECLHDIQDRAARDLLQRTRTKKQSLSSASRGGYSLTGEVMTNAMSEALLCFRLGRMKEAVRGILQILEEKPVENEVLQPFLGQMEKTHPKSGRIKYAHACSLIRMNEIDRAMARFITAARIEPAVAEDCLESIRQIAEERDNVPEDIERGLVELLLIKGDTDRAVQLLEKQLEDDPSRAGDIIEQVKPHAEIHRDALALHYLYMDAALIAEQTLRVLETLKVIHQDEENRGDLLEWLASRGKEQFLAPEILIFQAEMAIDQKDVGQAVDLLRAVAHNSPPDAPTVARILEKYRTMDERIAELLAEVTTESTAPAGGKGFEFEHFENTEFKFTSEDAEFEVEPEPEPASQPQSQAEEEEEEEEEEREADPDFDNFSGRSIFASTNEEEAEKQAERVETAGDRSETPPLDAEPEPASADGGTTVSEGQDSFEKSADFGHGDAIVWDEEDDVGTPELPDEETDPVIPRKRPAFPVDEEPSEEEVAFKGDVVIEDAPPKPEVTIEEETVATEAPAEDPVSSWATLALSGEHVQSVAYELRQSGAATFFHVENTEVDTTASEAPAAEAAETDTIDEIKGFPRAEASEVEDEPEPVDEIEEPEAEDEPEPVDEIEEPEAEDEPEPVDEIERVAVAEEAAEPEETLVAAAGFDERFQLFLAGDLKNPDVLDLIEEALDNGNEDALDELLYFHPSTPEEEFRRECFRMEYHLLGNRPRAALALIEAMDISRLADEDRRHVLMKKVASHRTMDDFEMAHDILVELVEEFPDEEEVARLAKQNYEQYLSNQCIDAPVLERTSSLTTDL